MSKAQPLKASGLQKDEVVEGEMRIYANGKETGFPKHVRLAMDLCEGDRVKVEYYYGLLMMEKLRKRDDGRPVNAGLIESDIFSTDGAIKWGFDPRDSWNVWKASDTVETAEMRVNNIRGTAVIPQRVRRRAGLQAGQTFSVKVRDGILYAAP
jgi:bifunctional DNA-binding transcriptional regulator/antitoxin component of YhaV-PrlF toxin-antitoxin module